MPTGTYRIIRWRKLGEKYSRVLHRCEACKSTTMRSCAWTNRPSKVWPNWKYCKYPFLWFIWPFSYRSLASHDSHYLCMHWYPTPSIILWCCLFSVGQELEVKWWKPKYNKFDSIRFNSIQFDDRIYFASFRRNEIHKYRRSADSNVQSLLSATILPTCDVYRIRLFDQWNHSSEKYRNEWSNGFRMPSNRRVGDFLISGERHRRTRLREYQFYNIHFIWLFDLCVGMIILLFLSLFSLSLSLNFSPSAGHWTTTT